MYRKSIAAITLLALTLASNAAADGRQWPRHADLMSVESAIDGPVPNDFFMPQDGAAKAIQDFSGTLRIPEHAMRTEPPEIKPIEIGGKRTQLFPGVDLQFVSHGEFLLPVERDLIVPAGSDSFWQIQVSPGHVWSEDGDQGMSRASFPFFLTSIIENETYSDIATFLYDEDSVSSLRYHEVFKIPSYPWGPGEFARYRDRDIFTLSAAIDGLYRKQEGENAYYWQMMLDEVYSPIGIHYMPMSRTREPDGRGVPLLAWGIYLTIDDIGKIAGLLQHGGMHDGVQLLSKAGLAEALYETDARGLPTGEKNEHGAKTYHLSLWHENYITASGKLCFAPRMAGYGGNIVQLMPNGFIGFRLGNGGDKPLEQMTIIADEIRPFDEHPRHR
jgi:hypothetical protein